jgi:hypothetical protein
VYRIESPSLDELEASAARLAKRAAGQNEDCKSHIMRGKGRSDLLLSDGIRARAYHPSGAIAVKAGWAPMEHLIGEKADKEALTKATIAASGHLGFDRLAASGEKLVFERLWQIKATGINRQRERGPEVVCRAIGAFRRYLGDLPVWGRASAVVELAANHRISGAAVDWRPVAPLSLDRAKVIDPERAARAIIADLNGRRPGGELADNDFDVAQFSLGYMSLPKRRAQGTFAPVYVALLEPRGWTTMNHVVVVNGSEKSYEDVCRLNAAPPREIARTRGKIAG